MWETNTGSLGIFCIKKVPKAENCIQTICLGSGDSQDYSYPWKIMSRSMKWMKRRTSDFYEYPWWPFLFSLGALAGTKFNEGNEKFCTAHSSKWWGTEREREWKVVLEQVKDHDITISPSKQYTSKKYTSYNWNLILQKYHFSMLNLLCLVVLWWYNYPNPH